MKRYFAHSLIVGDKPKKPLVLRLNIGVIVDAAESLPRELVLLQLSGLSFNRRQENLRSGFERDFRSFGLALSFAGRTPPCEKNRLLDHSARWITMH
jgi:hypothetical protein